MARKKEFDEFDVLQKAMEIFWRKGYEATSVQDLVEQTGINRGSLYDTFTDKRALFLATIQYYDDTVVTAVVTYLKSAHSAKQAIIDYVHQVAMEAAQTPDRRGCFLTNAAVEMGSIDPDAEKRLAASIKRIEAAFYQALARARADHEIAGQHDLRALARYLTSSVHGIRVMAKVNPDPKILMEIASLVLAVLD